MIFEYMAYGDLTEVLRNSSEQFMNYSASLPLLDRVSAKKNNAYFLKSLLKISTRCTRENRNVLLLKKRKKNVLGLAVAHIIANIGGYEVFGQSTVRAQRLGVPELFGRQRLVCENRRFRNEPRHLHLRLLQSTNVGRLWPGVG